jgi:hypothetical protein
MSPPWQAQPQGRHGWRSARRSCPGRGGGRPASQAAVRSTVPVRPAAAVTGSPPEQFGPVRQRLAVLADAGLHGQVARNRPCRVPLVRGRTDEPLWGGRAEPLLPDPVQVL